MIKLKNVLTEGLSPVLFHFTFFESLLNILRENKFQATTSLGSGAESPLNGKYFFHFSTTRIRNNGYYISGVADVCIVLDGRKLNSKYKGFPVDYWQRLIHKQSNAQYIEALKKLEQEDRVVLNSPTIDNASSYILELNILLPTESVREKVFNKENISELIELCKNNNIKIHFYKDRPSFRYNHKSNAIDINSIEFLEKTDEYKHDEEFRKRCDIKKNTSLDMLKLCTLLSYKNNDNYNKIFNHFKPNEKFITRFKENLEDGAYNIFNYPSQFRVSEYIDLLECDIHNMRSDATHVARFLLKMLADDIRKNRVSSLREYIAMKLNIKLDE